MTNICVTGTEILISIEFIRMSSRGVSEQKLTLFNISTLVMDFRNK